MRPLSSLSAVFRSVLLVFAIAVPSASAQEIFVTPIPNAPFSGVVKVERSVVVRDGSVFNSKTIRDIGRDSHGRIHNERRAIVPASYDKAPPLVRIHVYDPQTRISTWLDPKERTFWTHTVNHPPSTVPPAVRFASPTGDGIPHNEFTKEEDLGIHEMEGLAVRGVREIQTVPADNKGTGKEITITDEYWYSEDLRIYVMIKHSDPRKETVTMTITQVSRADPDPALFEVPSGYKRAQSGPEGEP
jgi:hypothetical protein